MRVCLLHPCDFCKAEIPRECGGPKRFCSLRTLRLMILLMSSYQMKSFNQLIKINEFFLAFRAVVLDICLPFMPIMTFCDTKKEIQIFS